MRATRLLARTGIHAHRRYGRPGRRSTRFVGVCLLVAGTAGLLAPGSASAADWSFRVQNDSEYTLHLIDVRATQTRGGNKSHDPNFGQPPPIVFAGTSEVTHVWWMLGMDNEVVSRYNVMKDGVNTGVLQIAMDVNALNQTRSSCSVNQSAPNIPTATCKADGSYKINTAPTVIIR